MAITKKIIFNSEVIDLVIEFFFYSDSFYSFGQPIHYLYKSYFIDMLHVFDIYILYFSSLIT